jgi:hypothetical protein
MVRANPVKALLLLLLLACAPTWAASYTASATGNWNNMTTWGGMGTPFIAPPGNNDTISNIADGVTVTVTDAEIIGQSGVNGTKAITIANGGALIIANGGDLKCRGDFQYAAWGGGITTIYLAVQAGGIFEWDSSHAASPSATKYSAYPDSNYGSRGFVATGTSVNHAIVRSNAGGGNGYFSLGGHAIGGSYVSTYTDFLNIGDATNAAFELEHWGIQAQNNPFPWDATHDTFTNCGTILTDLGGGGMVGSEVFRHDFNVHVNTLGASLISGPGIIYPLCNAVSAPNCPAVGVREIIGNVLDAPIGSPSDGLSALGFTIHSNYVGAGIETTGSGTPGNTWTMFQNNFYRIQPPRLSDPIALMGDSRDNLWFLDEYLSYNPHGPQVTASSGQTLSGNIVDHAGQILNQVSAFMITNAGVGLAANSTYSLTNSILLPNAAGHSSFWLSAIFQMSGESGTVFSATHNTGMFDSVFDGVGLLTAHPGALPNPAGQLSSYANNIFWNPTGANPAYKLASGQLTANLNVCAPTNCDYNDGFNTLTDGGASTGFAGGANGYADNFSGGTPGVHDLAVDPMFVDPTRNTATFDSAYLGNTAPAWDSSATYNAGDIVSSRDASVYATSINPTGALINYRYVNKQGCSTTNPKPGVVPASAGQVNVNGTSVTWVSGRTVEIELAGLPFYVAAVTCSPNCTTLTLPGGGAGSGTGIAYVATVAQACWEWASLYRIRQGVAAQTLYDDQSIGAHGVDIITVLMQWIRAGFSPSNPALALAGKDGQDIGAVPVSFAAPIYPSSIINGAVLRKGTSHGGVIR